MDKSDGKSISAKVANVAFELPLDLMELSPSGNFFNCIAPLLSGSPTKRTDRRAERGFMPLQNSTVVQGK